MNHDTHVRKESSISSGSAGSHGGVQHNGYGHTPKRGIQSHAAFALQRNPVSETFRDLIIDKTLLCKLQIPCERMVLRLVDRLIGRGAS